MYLFSVSSTFTVFLYNDLSFTHHCEAAAAKGAAGPIGTNLGLGIWSKSTTDLCDVLVSCSTCKVGHLDSRAQSHSPPLVSVKRLARMKQVPALTNRSPGCSCPLGAVASMVITWGTPALLSPGKECERDPERCRGLLD